MRGKVGSYSESGGGGGWNWGLSRRVGVGELVCWSVRADGVRADGVCGVVCGVVCVCSVCMWCARVCICSVCVCVCVCVLVMCLLVVTAAAWRGVGGR